MLSIRPLRIADRHGISSASMQAEHHAASPAPCSLWSPSPSVTPTNVGALLAEEDDTDRAGRVVEAHVGARVTDVVNDALRTTVGISTWALVVTSPRISTRPVVVAVSQATRSLRVLERHRIQDRVGDLVAHLVGMSPSAELEVNKERAAILVSSSIQRPSTRDVHPPASAEAGCKVGESYADQTNSWGGPGGAVRRPIPRRACSSAPTSITACSASDPTARTERTVPLRRRETQDRNRSNAGLVPGRGYSKRPAIEARRPAGRAWSAPSPGGYEGLLDHLRRS